MVFLSNPDLEDPEDRTVETVFSGNFPEELESIPGVSHTPPPPQFCERTYRDISVSPLAKPWLPAAAMAKQAADMPAEGILNRVQQCKFGGHAQHTAAPYGFVDGTGAFPHSGLLFNCVTGEGKGRRAAIDHRNWRPIHDGHPEFVVNLSSRACGACRLVLRVHVRELVEVTATQRDVSGSSAGGISDPHEGRGAGGASTSRAIPHDVLICN